MKIKALFIVGFFLFVLSGCGSNAQTNNESKNDKGPISENRNEGKTIPLTKEKFLKHVMNYEKNTEKWVYEGKIPGFIDFYADWCAPCRITSPIIDELAGEYAGKVQFYKIDTEDERELAAVFGIQALPTFLLIPLEGQPYLTSGIARTPEETKQMFKDQIDQYLLKKEL